MFYKLLAISNIDKAVHCKSVHSDLTYAVFTVRYDNSIVK